jgi:hypothetical protein
VLNTLNRARFTVAVDSFIKTGRSQISVLNFSGKCKNASRIIYMATALIICTSKAALTSELVPKAKSK